MNVREYLSKKYDTNHPTTILACECAVFGMPYPTPSGWLKMYGDIVITAAMRKTLIDVLSKAQKATAADGLLALGVDPTQKPQEKLTKRELRALSRDVRRKAKIAALQEKLERPQKPKGPSYEEANSPDFLQSYAWRSLRWKVIQHYGSRCMCCGATPETGAVMHVDHIFPRRLRPDLALDFDNLQVLCQDCNHGKGNNVADLRPEMIDHAAVSFVRSIAFGC